MEQITEYKKDSYEKLHEEENKLKDALTRDESHRPSKEECI